MELVLPSTRSEAWRWSSPEAIQAAMALPYSDAAAAADGYWLDLPGARIVVRDGVIDRAASELDGVEIADLSGDDHALGQYAAGAGWSLTLGREAAFDPVQVVHLATGGANHLPSRIVLGEDAVGQVVETYVGSGWSNRSLTVELGRSARLMRAVRVVQDGGFVSLRDAVTVGQGASFVNTLLGAGVAGSRYDAAVTLAGEAGYAEVGGALLTAGNQRQECAVRVRHAEPNGQSHQWWRAVAAEASVASLAAAVEVARHAQKTDGEQSLRGLLLDRSATVNLKPELEIFADDVKCAHGATVGELDARALFYLASRGVAPARAKALLTRAFVADAIDRIGDATVREAFAADADAWLERVLQSPSRLREGLGEGLS